MILYHYTTVQNLKSILESGGSFYNTKGFYNEDIAGFYFTDLEPETSNSDLQRSLFGLNTTRSNPALTTQAYLELDVDGRQKYPGRNHVYYILVSSPNLIFKLRECGQRKGWQQYGRPYRDKWNLSSYISNFCQKRRYSYGNYYIQGLKRNVWV